MTSVTSRRELVRGVDLRHGILSGMETQFRDSMAVLETEHWWFRARRNILERAVERLVGDTDRALAVGLGIPGEAAMLSKRTRLVAIDWARIDPRCQDFALVTQGDGAALPFADEVFDAMFMFDVLEHIREEEAALAEACRVLRPGGRLLVTVPAFMLLYGVQDVVSEHLRRYRRNGLCALLERSGFEVEHATYYNTILFPPIAAVRLFRRLMPASPGGDGDFDLRFPGFVETLLEKIFSLERHTIDRLKLPLGISVLCSARRVGG